MPVTLCFEMLCQSSKCGTAVCAQFRIAFEWEIEEVNFHMLELSRNLKPRFIVNGGAC